MREIADENALEYLRSAGRLGAGPARAQPLGWGVSNAVLRVETPDRLFVLKQSRPQLRTRDAWLSDLDRVYREQEGMQALRPLLPSLVVPEVLFSDRANYVCAMSHAPRAAQVWKRHHARGGHFELTRAFWRGYRAEATFRPFVELQERGIGHFAVCLLARIDGTSPVDYLPEEPKREAVRRLGRRVLWDRPREW